ncbi:hypothetical protein G6553_16395 [Nocardioides sp. IC4_145]|uniref:hypothetical protein n=1 Tax=Nocardioides sp. IC4_145 TaxID=2714037 RepID=UPI00140A96D9|nr:hypothetical protein [Nocardioides sp. IC4_145]NHC24747.1 hypothetical protein [Nocardioides sp. IC4_145]
MTQCRTGRRTKKRTNGWTAGVGAIGVVAGLVVGGLAGGAATAADGPELVGGKKYKPVPSTIVSVTGDKKNGFEIRRYDGSEQFPPTDSEARAECNEYDTEVARVRCRSEVRTWYRDLGDMKRAIHYARSSASGS